MGVGALPLTALQHADRLARKAGPLGELLLREPRSFAQSPEQRPERDVLPENNALSFAFRHAISIPTTPVSENAGASPRRERSKCSHSVPTVWMVRSDPGRQTSG